MPEPKVRFKRDDGSSYPDWTIRKMGALTNEYKVRNKTKLPLEIYSVNNEVGFLPQSEQFEDAGYLNDTDTSIYMIVPPNHFAYNPARINIGSIGYQNVGHDVQVSSLYEVFKTTEELDDNFLWHWFHTPIFKKAVLSLQEGGVRLYFYFEKLKETSISLPGLGEQQKIADFLSSVDKVIAASEEEVANLETQKKAAMKKIFSQEVRFKRNDGTDFPDWEEKKLGDVCSKIGSGKTPKGGSEIYTQNGVLFIRSQNVINAMLDLTDRTCIPKSVHDEMRNTELQYLDVLLNITGASIGRCCLFDLHETANVNQHVCIIRLKDKESYVPKYVEQIMLSDYIQNQIWSCQNGGSREGLNFEQIGNFSFLSPCLEEQRLIADFLSDFDEAIAAAKKELELWKELKKGLLQQMFV